MKKLCFLILIVFTSGVLLSSCSSVTKSADAAVSLHRDKYVYLVAGFDDAAENTDVLFTVSYNPDNNTAYVAQIPRDTYYKFGSGQNKINQIYATLISEGKAPEDALDITSRKIADLFGTKFDGWFGIKVDTFEKVIDAIGGIELAIPEDMALSIDDGKDTLVLKKGKNLVDGKSAVNFVRYRSGYAMGDLGRIDAQKLFLNAIFYKMSEGVSLPLMFKLANTFQNKVLTNVKLFDVLSLYIDAMNMKEERKVCYVTVPGQPVESSGGLSFYVLNRKSAAEIARKYMFATEKFDTGLLCKNCNESKFELIYEDSNLKYREYTNKNLSKVHIVPKT